MSKKFLAPILITVGLLLAGISVGQNIKLNPIKPGAKSSANISDEQQAILAVRKAKASVVSINGLRTYVGRGNSTPIIEPLEGTGFIYSKDGLVVSNSHVVQSENTEYFVVLGDGKEYRAKVLGLDKYNDVGVLKIDAPGLTPAVLGNSADLETGQSVFAIGNSLGRYQNTVTRGVVSGLGRTVSIGTPDDPRPRFQNLIQTDAAINPGNSGGPLVNMAGEVIGINTLVDRTGEGVGFAVPVSAIRDSVNQLLAFGKASHPYAGLVFATINKLMKIQENLTVDQGSLVISVGASGPAYNSGVRVNDVILEINHEKLTERSELDAVLQKYKSGDTVLLKLMRNGEIIETPLLLGEYK